MDAVAIDQLWRINATDPAAMNVAAEVSDRLPKTSNGEVMAKALVQALREHGLLTDFVVVLQADQTLKVEKYTPSPSGKYGKYLTVEEGTGLTKEALDTALARARAEASANHEQLTVRIDNPDATNHAPVVLDAVPLTTPLHQESFVASSLGPRYASTDVVTFAGSRVLGDGYAVDGSVTKGLPDVRADSRGGDYLGINGGVSKATVYGLVIARASHSDYKVGGVNRPLHQRGAVDKLALEWSRPLSAELTPLVRLETTRQTSKLLGTFSDSLTNTAVIGGLQFSRMLPNGAISADLAMEQGLHQSRSVDAPFPLLGETSANYHTVSGNVARQLIYQDWAITGKTGFQMGSTNTPASSQFYIGGPDRGSASHTGVFAGASGAFGSVQAVGPSFGTLPAWTITSIKPVIGLDGGFVKTTGGAKMHTAAFSAGVQLASIKDASASLTLALPLHDSTGTTKPRFGFFFQTAF